MARSAAAPATQVRERRMRPSSGLTKKRERPERRSLSCRIAKDQVPRQEPGRYFDGTVVTKLLPPTAAVLPQTQAYSGLLLAVSICTLPVATGTRVTYLPSMVLSPMPCTVTCTAPRASVETRDTYFDVAAE